MLMQLSTLISRRALAGGLVLLAAVSLFPSAYFRSWTMAADDKPAVKHIVHNVFFALNESTPAARQKLVDACKKYLTGHEGTVYFSAGVVSDALNRPVNDREWDVGLHLVFNSLASHDKYQEHPRHQAFIDENKATWKKVRVFDSEVDPK